MDVLNIPFPIIKAVKKTTYNSLINQVHLKINSENEPIQKVGGPRSQSFKKVTRFVPILKPKKSTFIPTPLKLNNEKKSSKNNEEDKDFDKQKSGDEIQIIDDDDNSSFFSNSSSVENSIDEDIKIKGKNKHNKDKEDKEDKEDKDEKEEEEKEEKEDKIGTMLKTTPLSINEKLESKDIDYENDSFNLNDVKEGEENNKNMRILRRKMSQIKAKACINKSKETEEIINGNLKKNFDIGLKKYEKEDDSYLYKSLNVFDLKKSESEKPKIKSIFEVISFK